MTNAEAISTIQMAKAETEWNFPMDYQVAFDMAIEALKCIQGWEELADDLSNKAPTMDVVEVVRCKDCKEWQPVAGRTKCIFDQYTTGEDGFCSVGRRRTDERPND